MRGERRKNGNKNVEGKEGRKREKKERTQGRNISYAGLSFFLSFFLSLVLPPFTSLLPSLPSLPFPLPSSLPPFLPEDESIKKRRNALLIELGFRW